MSRGDKNQRGTSSRDNSNQGNQPSVRNDKDEKSDHAKTKTGQWPSEPQRHSASDDVERGVREPGNSTRSLNNDERKFNLLVDSVPYMVSATPFRFNGEIRYRISFNGGTEHVFTWDSSLGQLRAIDDEASTLPDNLEEAISEKLQSKA